MRQGQTLAELVADTGWSRATNFMMLKRLIAKGAVTMDDSGKGARAMKKWILFLMLCISLLLSGCQKTPETLPAAQEQTEQAPGIDQSDAEYDNVKTWRWAPYETLYRTDGVRMGLVQEADGRRHIGEVPDTKVWIRLKDGTLLSDAPFDACIDYMDEPEGEVYCIRNGTGYCYTVSAGDGSFRLSEVDEPEILEEDQFGYRLRVTRWDSREPCYGIVTADGTEVIAPVYERVEIPFPDRFLLYEGGASQGPVMGRCRLTDETGSTLCARFHWIDYSVFDDGYIGIAVCYGERAAYPCYDEDGQPMPEGYWLVDRDGNLCSERFAKLSFGDGDETHAASEDDVLHARREDGTEDLLLYTLDWASCTQDASEEERTRIQE